MEKSIAYQILWKHIVGLEYNYCICILQNFTGETKNVLY